MRQLSLPAYLLPRLRDILFLLVFSAAMLAGWRTLNGDGDLPRHLLMGRIILETRSIPRQELFSYLYEGQPYVAHEWLADVVYYLSFKLLGMGGVVLLTALLIASTFFVLAAALAQEYEDRLLTMLLLGWGAVCSYWHWVARPHLFSMLFLAVWLVGVDRMSRGKAVKLWWLPALMLIWANTHAEFVAGFLVLIAYMAGWLWDFLLRPGEADRRVIVKLAITAGSSALASLLNPFGLGTWTTILSYLGNTQLMSTVNETMPPDFSSGLFIVEFALIVASVAILGLQRGATRTGQVFLLAGFTALAMRSGRNIHLYSVIAPFVLAGPLIEITKSAFQARVTSAIAGIESKLKGLAWPVATVLVSVALLFTGKIRRYYLFDPGIFPVEAVTWLEANPQPGHMFNDFLWGGYIMWRLWPSQKDFIDSQSDLSGEATVEYLTVEKLRDGWQTVLERHDVAWVIMPSDSILSRELVQDGWTVLHRDSTAIILRRD
jgi:hypothetical protein